MWKSRTKQTRNSNGESGERAYIGRESMYTSRAGYVDRNNNRY